jgi:hypothetical protein
MYAIENATKRASEFNAANPTSPPLNWRDLIPLVMPAGQTIALQDPEAIAVQAEAAKANTEAAGAEMLGVKRSDWKNSRKAINDILAELAAKTISEQRARLELDSIGIPPAKIDAYIADAIDGSLDAVEEITNA